MMFKEDLEHILGIKINDKQEEQFEKYYTFLIEYNKNINLTRITEHLDVYYKHFYDSLTLAQTLDFNKIEHMCDMGSGAGFPSIPLKIIYPQLKVTIVDSLNKRVTFLKELTKLLDLSDINLYHDRVEIFANNHQNTYDLVTARALGNMQLISEMGLPMTKIGGWFVAYKSQNYEQEMKDAKQCIKKLGGETSTIKIFDLPHDFGQRVHIVINKKKHIDGYPRSFVKMTKNPL